MRRKLVVFLLAGCSLFWPPSGLCAEGPPEKEDQPAGEVGINDEDRQVVRMMELLQLMELLKDMELLEGETKVVSEEKK